MRDQRYNYSYIMMDSIQFSRYEKYCQKRGLACNYNRIGTDCYGVMMRNEKVKAKDVREVNLK